jgi:hypothetical protein
MVPIILFENFINTCCLCVVNPYSTALRRNILHLPLLRLINEVTIVAP